MSSHVQSIRAYKDITLQQLRSFCETVRVGSLTAAADALGLARPTVWKQVHALERQLGMLLLEPHARLPADRDGNCPGQDGQSNGDWHRLAQGGAPSDSYHNRFAR